MKKLALTCTALFAGLLISTSAFACPGDFDNDGTVGITDLMQMLSVLQAEGSDIQEDLNGDGKVDMTDLMDFLSILGTECED